MATRRTIRPFLGRSSPRVRTWREANSRQTGMRCVDHLQRAPAVVAALTHCRAGRARARHRSPSCAQDWRRFQKDGPIGWRPEGRAGYTNQDLAAARMRNAFAGASSRVPSPQELTGDVRFWLALLIGAAFVPVLFSLGASSEFAASAVAGDVVV